MGTRGETVRAHLNSFFAGHIVAERRWLLGPMVREHPSFYVLEVAPGPRSSLWVYVSVGASDMRQNEGAALEFILACPSQSDRGVELVTMSARYHRTQGLDQGHTLPIGEPWLPGATCDHILISLPYPWGPDFEVLRYAQSHIHILWLLPITAAERGYKAEHGQEALEVLLEKEGLEYWRVDRCSVTGQAR
jgi:Suppressor of fused protein (SUFU)